jgi:hypothetical protein
MQVLARLALSSQTVGPLLRTLWPAKPTGKIQQKINLMNKLQWKNTLTFFSSNAFVFHKNSTNLPSLRHNSIPCVASHTRT